MMGMRVSAAALVYCSAGCTVGPNYESPSAWSPASWFRTTRTETATTPVSLPVAEPLDVEWWNVLQDRAADLPHAPRRQRQPRRARCRFPPRRSPGPTRRHRAPPEFPTLNGNGSYTREQPSKLGVISLLGGSGGGGSGGSCRHAEPTVFGGTPGRGSRTPFGLGAFDLFQAGFDASWELDLWGKVRRQVESASAQVEASTEARRNTLLTSLAELARNYVQLRGLQESERIVRSNLSSAEQSVRLTDQRVRRRPGHRPRPRQRPRPGRSDRCQPAADRSPGTASHQCHQPPPRRGPRRHGRRTGEPGKPLAAGSPHRADRPAVRTRPAAARTSARPTPSSTPPPPTSAPPKPISTRASPSPAASRSRRPSSAAPSTSTPSPTASAPASRSPSSRAAASPAPSSSARSTAKEAAITYQKTVLQAFHDVDNALIAYRTDQLRRDRLAAQGQRRAAAPTRSPPSATRNGLSDFLEVLTAQRTLLQAEQDTR